MPKVQGLRSLRNKLRELAEKAKQEDATVIVGFTQRYALFVHEDLTKHHEVGQAKYLEQPARLLGPSMARELTNAVKRGSTLKQGLAQAGLLLQREAQRITPVDTGALRASAFTAYEEDYEQVASQAFERSERIRKAKKR